MGQGAVGTFAVKDCALLAIATGQRAHDLRELRAALLQVPTACIYYHFWGRLLRPAFDDPEFSNDFASWSRHALHDHMLAERFGVIDPTDFADFEDLRRELLEVIDRRLDEREHVPSADRDHPFSVLRGQVVVFNTLRRVSDPPELSRELPAWSVGSIYYHLIDARRRTATHTDDVRAWLEGFGDAYGELIARLAKIDPFLCTLAQLRNLVSATAAGYFAERETAGA